MLSVNSAAVAVDRPVSPEDPQTVRSGRLIATMIPLKIDVAICDLHPRGGTHFIAGDFKGASSFLTTLFDVSVSIRVSIT